MMKYGILGGGLSAVTLSYYLNYDNEILEKEKKIGGLCRTFEKDGFQYDIGGHILFSKDSKLMDVVKSFLGENINYCKRNNKIIYKNRFMKYPFENDLYKLDKNDLYDCLIGFLKNDYNIPNNYEEWIYYTFGYGIADKYLIPYNKKIWKEKLSSMSLEWVERIPRPPLEDIIKSAIGIETEGYTHQLHFIYPKYGGIEGLVNAIAKDNKNIITDYEINSIIKKNNQWMVSNGAENKYYDKLVSTIPINELLKFLNDVPEKVLKCANQLRHNMVRVVMVGINNDSLLDKSAIYIPQSDVIFHRICYMGYFSKNTIPSGASSLIAEVTTHRNNELYNISDDVLTEIVVNDINKLDIADKNSVIVTDIQNLEYGYVVYDVKYSNNLMIIKDYLYSIGIILLGRFAEFEYINMDEVIKRSINLANKINNVKEI